MHYAGIGSRETPWYVCALMTKIAQRLAKRGYILRSGHADGADKAFEAGAGDMKEIFVPWKDFNGWTGPFVPVSEEAMALASRYHPNWEACSRGAKALHGRNGYQVLGADLSTPVRFVLCWTVEGSGKGGTGQALRIAADHQIPILDFGKYDLAQPEQREQLYQKIAALLAA